jgi:hypothetical protein
MTANRRFPRQKLVSAREIPHREPRRRTLTLRHSQLMMGFGDETIGRFEMAMQSPKFIALTAAFGLFAVLAAFGCTPRVDGADEAATSSAAPSVTADEIAVWRETVSRLHAEVAELSQKSAASNEQSQRRLRELTEDLAKLEKRIAAHTPTQTEAGKVVVDDPAASLPKPTLPSPRLDEQVQPANLQTPAAEPRSDHPFAPAVKRAKASLAAMAAIKDYSAVMVKQERINGKLNEMEFIHAKIRHEPFSVYLRFLAPKTVRDREVIYVAGQNNGNLIAHESPNRGLIGILAQKVGPTSLDPKSTLAMIGNRYPITEIGLLNLTKRLIEVGEHDMRYPSDQAKATYHPNAKVEGRDCEAYVFVHPTKSKDFTFHRAEVFIDKEFNLPIRYASYDWPEAAGETPPLIETYTYTRLKLNVGLKDEDFDVKNPKYKFSN